MPSKLKNTRVVFFKVVVVAFKEYIHKFVEVYLDYNIVYSLLNDHVAKLRLMLDRCW